MFVSCECCVLSGRGLCDKLITRPEESYRLWCVVVCDPETSRMRRSWPALGRSATGEKKIISTSKWDYFLLRIHRLLLSRWSVFTARYGPNPYIQGGSNMTGTDLCVNKPQSVPVIFEPPCIIQVKLSLETGCTMAQAVRRRPLTAKALLLSQVSAHKIWWWANWHWDSSPNT